MTPLSVARIAGEVGLAGGTATGGAFAAHYGKQVAQHKRVLHDAETPLKNKLSDITGKFTGINTWWTQIKNGYNGEYKSDMDDAVKQLETAIGIKTSK